MTNSKLQGGLSVSWMAMLKSSTVWVLLGFALGLKPYLDHVDNSGVEAVVFLVMGLMFGVIGGFAFNLLFRLQFRHGAFTPLQAALTGVSAASVFIIINAVQAAFASGEGSKGSSDLIASAVVLALGGVAGLFSGALLKTTPKPK